MAWNVVILGGGFGGLYAARKLERTIPPHAAKVTIVTGADPDRKQVFVTTMEGEQRTLRYDQLIVALGSISRTLPIPGLKEHAIGFKTLSDAIALRNQAINALE